MRNSMTRALKVMDRQAGSKSPNAFDSEKRGFMGRWGVIRGAEGGLGCGVKKGNKKSIYHRHAGRNANGNQWEG